MLPMPMPANAIPEPTSRPVVPPAAERSSKPAVASSMDNSAVRSRPMRCAMRGVKAPNSANAAVGIIPNTPVMAVPKPNVRPSSSSNGVSEVTAVRRLNADSTMPTSTRPRPDQSDLEREDEVPCGGAGVFMSGHYRRCG